MQGFNLISRKPEIVWIDTNSIDITRMEPEYYKSKYLEGITKIENIPFTLLEEIVTDVKDGPGGWGIKASEYVNSGVPMLRGVNIIGGLLSIDDCVYITHKKQEELKRSKVVKDDVLLVVRGSIGIGKSAVYNKEYEANMNAAVVKITLKSDIVDPYYVSCFFNSRYGRLQTERLANGVNQQNTNLTEVKSNKIPMPAVEVQKYIGRKVKLAEELREKSKLLRAEAVKLIEEGSNSKLLINRYDSTRDKCKWIQQSEITERIDGQFYNNPIMGISNEMEVLKFNVVKLSRLAKIGKGFSYTQSNYNENIPYVRISDLDDLTIDFSNVIKTDLETYEKKKDSQLRKYDLITAITGATIGKISLFHDCRSEKATLSADTAYIRFINIDDAITYLIYFKTNIGQLSILQGVTGVTNKHLSLEHIKEIKVPVFREDVKRLVKERILMSLESSKKSNELIAEAQRDVEDIVEGIFDMSKLNETTFESR